MKPLVSSDGPSTVPGGEGERVVGGVGEHAAVQKAVLLLELVTDVELQGGGAVTERRHPGTEQDAERLVREPPAGELKIEHNDLTSLVK